MKANELRIGNFIKLKEIVSSDSLIRVSTYHIIDILNNSSKCEPVVITEEWLLNLGFIKDEEVGYRWYLEWDNCVIIAYDLDDKCIRVSDTWEFGKREYVHQLQNLYFALTGVELELSSNVA